jgi:uncharacterized protein YuzE
MEQIRVFYDPIGNTLTVWFGNPADEEVSEETGEEIILMKNKDGDVIGFEKLNFAKQPGQVNVRFETVSMPPGVKAS